MKSRFLAVAAITGAALLATAGIASAAPSRGVVVNWRAASHTATVATAGGKLLAIHTAKAVRPGAKVRIAKLTKLSNGTFRGRLVRAGKVRTAHFRAQVTGRVKGHVVLSAHGTTFVVRTAKVRSSHERGGDDGGATTTPTTPGAPPAGGAASCATPPPTGQYVIADVTITQTGELECEDMDDDHGVAGAVEIEGTVTSLGACAPGPSYAAPAYDPSAPSATPGLSPICVAIEDDGVGAAFTLLVPDPTQFAVGDEIEAKATKNADGTFTLVSASDDDEGEHHGGSDD